MRPPMHSQGPSATIDTVFSGSSLNKSNIASYDFFELIARCSCTCPGLSTSGVKCGCVSEMFDSPSIPCCHQLMSSPFSPLSLRVAIRTK